MIWLIPVVVIMILLCWLLISPLIVEVDTRVPKAGLRWISIGAVSIWYEGDWWLAVRILFYHKTIRLSEIKARPKRIKGTTQKKKLRKTRKISQVLKKMIRVIRTFRLVQWQLAIDTGDSTRNAQLYPLNFLPPTFERLHINFRDENYLVLKIRNRPWKILYAFLK